MRRIDLLSGIFWCLILALSCTSEESESPQVQFISPALNTLHDLNSELDVEIIISDDKMIKEYKFWLESENGLVYFQDEKQIDKIRYKLMYRFDLSGHLPGHFSIHMVAKDYDGNKSSKYLDVSTI